MAYRQALVLPLLQPRESAAVSAFISGVLAGDPPRVLSDGSGRLAVP